MGEHPRYGVDNTRRGGGGTSTGEGGRATDGRWNEQSGGEVLWESPRDDMGGERRRMMRRQEAWGL